MLKIHQDMKSCQRLALHIFAISGVWECVFVRVCDHKATLMHHPRCDGEGALHLIPGSTKKKEAQPQNNGLQKVRRSVSVASLANNRLTPASQWTSCPCAAVKEPPTFTRNSRLRAPEREDTREKASKNRLLIYIQKDFRHRLYLNINIYFSRVVCSEMSCTASSGIMTPNCWNIWVAGLTDTCGILTSVRKRRGWKHGKVFHLDMNPKLCLKVSLSYFDQNFSTTSTSFALQSIAT